MPRHRDRPPRPRGAPVAGSVAAPTGRVADRAIRHVVAQRDPSFRRDRSTAIRGPSCRSSAGSGRRRSNRGPPSRRRSCVPGTRSVAGGRTWRGPARTPSTARGTTVAPRPAGRVRRRGASGSRPRSRARRSTTSPRIIAPPTARIRQHPGAEPGDERAEVQSPASSGPSHGRLAGGDEGERDECPDQQDRVLPDAGEDERREDRHERRGERPAGREHEIELGQVGRARAGPGQVVRGARSATMPNAPSSIVSTTSSGQPPAEPYGTHSRVIIAGAARTLSRTAQPPRGEKATMNDAR